MSRVSERRTRQAGFTLVELTVALLAGLVVALGIVGLSHEATQSFNEESRSSAAESAMRTALDRLRADIARAGYMSTGNILSDPMIAHDPTKTNLQNLTNNAMTGIKELGALQVTFGGSNADSYVSKLSVAQNPALAPVVMLVGGNMTSAEQFDVQAILPPSSNCQQILLSPVSAAIYRIATSGFGASGSSSGGGSSGEPNSSQALDNIFAPVQGNGTTAQFMVRLLDDTGHTQYLATCPRADVAGITNGQPYLWIDSTDTQILTASQTSGQGGISGYAAGKAWVNPVQLVRWEITSAPSEALSQAQFASLGNIVQTGEVDPYKFDLMRSYVDVFGHTIVASSEIVAEYAVDFDLAFTVDTGTTIQPNFISYAFGDTLNGNWAGDISKLTSATSSPPVNIGPQRIRSVRVRLVTRTALPDRTANVPVAVQYGNEEYMYRYCTPLPGQGVPSCSTADGTVKWARTRTVTTEVSLPNLAGAYY